MPVIEVFLTKTQMSKAVLNEDFIMTASDMRKKFSTTFASSTLAIPNLLLLRMIRVKNGNKSIVLRGHEYNYDVNGDDNRYLEDFEYLTDEEGESDIDIVPDYPNDVVTEFNGDGIKKKNPWLNHIKKTQAKHKCSYKTAMILAAKSYKK